MPKLVQISTAITIMPVQNPLNPSQVNMQTVLLICALDEDGHAWEFARQPPPAGARWIPMTRDFASVPETNGNPAHN